ARRPRRLARRGRLAARGRPLLRRLLERHRHHARHAGHAAAGADGVRGDALGRAVDPPLRRVDPGDHPALRRFPAGVLRPAPAGAPGLPCRNRGRLQARRMNELSMQIGSSRMHAITMGEGPPVVLVHGFGVSGAYMHPLAEALAASFTVFIPDLPGQGESEKLRGRTTIARLGRALGEWIEATGLAAPSVVANSMGCQVVTELAVRRPRLVGPMVLVGPTIDPARRGAPGQLLGVLRDSAREPFAVLARAARDDARTGMRILMALGRSMIDDRIEDRLPSIEQPTVVVHGERDGFGSREWAEQAASLLPQGR